MRPRLDAGQPATGFALFGPDRAEPKTGRALSRPGLSEPSTGRGEFNTGLEQLSTGLGEHRTDLGLCAIGPGEHGSPLRGRKGRLAAVWGWSLLAGPHPAQVEPYNEFTRIKYERAVGDRAGAGSGGHIMTNKPNGHARGRSHVATGLMAVVGTGVVVGLGLGYSERPVGLCVLAIAGLIAVLLCLTVLRTPLASLLSTLAGRHGAHFAQGPIVRVGLWVLLLLVSLVAVLWPATLPWTLFAAFALLGASASVELLRLHPEFGVSKIASEEAKGRRWAWGGLSGMCAAWFMALVPGQVVHALGGPVKETPGAVLAEAIGDFEGRIMARFDRLDANDSQQNQLLVQQGQKLDRALSLLEQRWSEVRGRSAGDTVPHAPLPLSAEDRAILDAAKPFADAITRYRIAVAEGDDEAAGQLEEDVLAQRDSKREEEDFLFERTRGDRHFNAGRFDEAIPAYRTAHNLRPADVMVLNDLALSLAQMRFGAEYGAKLIEAEELLALALGLARAGSNTHQYTIAMLMNNLASVRQSLGRPSESAELYGQALQILIEVRGIDHFATATCCANYASALNDLGRHLEAESMAIQALDIREGLYSGDHPAIASSMNSLGTTLSALGRNSEAREQLDASLEMRRRLYKGDHLEIATTAHNLGIVLEALGQYSPALRHHSEGLEMRERLLGSKHPDISHSLNSLASVHSELGDASSAEQLYRRALDISLHHFDGDHPSIALLFNNLGTTLDDLGRTDEAESLYRDSLAMCRRLFDGDHPSIAVGINNVAYVLSSQNEHVEAQHLYGESLAMYKRLHSGDHPDVASALGNLASSLRSLGQISEASSVYEQALRMNKRLYTGDHPQIALSLCGLGAILADQDRLDEAYLAVQEGVAMGRRCLPSDHPDLRQWEHNLAAIQKRQGR